MPKKIFRATDLYLFTAWHYILLAWIFIKISVEMLAKFEPLRLNAMFQKYKNIKTWGISMSPHRSQMQNMAKQLMQIGCIYFSLNLNKVSNTGNKNINLCCLILTVFFFEFKFSHS